MRKILVLFLFLSIPSFALSLNQVRVDLKKNSISGDSLFKKGKIKFILK